MKQCLCTQPSLQYDSTCACSAARCKCKGARSAHPPCSSIANQRSRLPASCIGKILCQNEDMQNLQEALTGRFACRCGIRGQGYHGCQMLSMTSGALCAWCSTLASSVPGHEVISWEYHLRTGNVLLNSLKGWLSYRPVLHPTLLVCFQGKLMLMFRVFNVLCTDSFISTACKSPGVPDADGRRVLPRCRLAGSLLLGC